MYDHKRTNPPSHFASEMLATLSHALTHYDGTDRYAHPYRQGRAEVQITASVLVLITNETTPRLLLTKRSQRLTAHAGEVSFVGGKRDETDTDTAHTALREACEEVGLDGADAHIIGYLPCQTAKSGSLVRPVVAVVAPDVAQALVGSADEIERVFWGELSHFIHTPPSEIVLNYDNQPPFATPAWTVADETVWGLTGRIIANLVEIGFGVRYAWYYRLS